MEMSKTVEVCAVHNKKPKQIKIVYAGGQTIRIESFRKNAPSYTYWIDKVPALYKESALQLVEDWKRRN